MRIKLFAVLAAALLTVGCTANQKNSGALFASPLGPQAMPQIISSSQVDGRNYPFGRSDSPAGFIKLTEISSDPSYGYTQQNPVKVGGGAERGSRNSQAYLNALRGPKGEVTEYERIGACCPSRTAILDAYRVIYPGQESPTLIYVNMYEPPLSIMAPMGFTPRSTANAFKGD